MVRRPWMLQNSDDHIGHGGHESYCEIDYPRFPVAPDDDEAAARSQAAIEIAQGLREWKVMKAGHQCDRIPLTSRVALVESSLFDHYGRDVGEARCRHACRFGVRLDPGHVFDPHPETADQIACAAPDVQNAAGFARRDSIDHPTSVEVVVTPWTPSVEPIDA